MNYSLDPALSNMVALLLVSWRRVRSGFHWEPKENLGSTVGAEGKINSRQKQRAQILGQEWGVRASSRNRPPQAFLFKHIEGAENPPGPLSFTRFLRWHNDGSDTQRHRAGEKARDGASGRWRWCPDTSRAGTGKGGSASPGLPSFDHSCYWTRTKVSSWENRAAGSVTWGMYVNPALGSHAVLFNPSDQTWYTRAGCRASSACAAPNPTAHAEPPRTAQAPTEKARLHHWS
jgi:hypothetical protein